MAKPHKEKALKEQYPNFEELLVDVLNEHGQTYAAVHFGVSQATISLMVKRSSRIRKIDRYELLPEQEAQTAQPA